VTDEWWIDQEGRIAIRANADDLVRIDREAASSGRAVDDWDGYDVRVAAVDTEFFDAPASCRSAGHFVSSPVRCSALTRNHSQA